MEKPKCRVCGSRHWSHETHELSEAVVAAVQRREVGDVEVGSVADSVPAESGAGAVDSDAAGAGGASGDGAAGGVGSEVSEGCDECGSTPEIFADAEKWRNYREQKRRYMRERRSK